MTKFNKNNSAFTLVELAIVIVIIGLLVGGVLQGQELIKRASEKSIITNVESYKSAIISFKGKYNCVPGDCNNHALFFGSIGITEGNMSGLIDQDSEVFEIWRVLGLSKFIKGSYSGYQGSTSVVYTSIPKDSADIGYLYRCMPSAITSLNATYTYNRQICGFWASRFGTGQNTNNAGYAIMTPREASAFDTKFDDGVAYTGKVIATRYTNAWGTCTSNDAYGVGVTSAIYLSNDNLECVMVFDFTP